MGNCNYSIDNICKTYTYTNHDETKEQHALSKVMEEVKERYKNNKQKLESELQKVHKESRKSMLGGFVGALQIPVIYALYTVIVQMPVQTATVLMPWVANIKMADTSFIIPVLYTFTMLCPNLLNYIPFLKVSYQVKVSKVSLIITSIFSVVITLKAPIALGIYFITTSIFSFIEEILFRICYRNKSMCNR